MIHTDVVIHIDEDLDDEHIHDLEKGLAMRDGVYSACVHESRRHLMLVDYDPQDVASSDLLSQVRSTGVHAELIGL